MNKFVVFVVSSLLCLSAGAKDYGTYEINKDDILRVYDGDTFHIKRDDCPPVLCEKIGVRVNGIDTPEIRGKCQSEKELALSAKEELRSALEEGTMIELRHTTKEKYGRLLGELYIDGENFGEKLVYKGLARRYDGSTRQSWCE